MFLNISNQKNTTTIIITCAKINWTAHSLTLSFLIIIHLCLFLYVILLRSNEYKKQKLNTEYRSKRIFEMQNNKYQQQHKKRNRHEDDKVLKQHFRATIHSCV
jgi:hypothetical protein